MKLQRIAQVAPLVAVSLVLAACSTGSGGNNGAPDPNSWRDGIEGTALEVGVLTAEGTPGLEYLKTLADQLGEEYPGADVTLTFANSEARPGLEQRWRSGDGPDVDYGMFDGSNPAQRVWAQDGLLLDLRPYLEAEDPETGEPWLDSFSPAAIDFMTDPDDNGIYAVPTELSTQVLFYNAGLFKELGITPPTTWGEFLTASDALKAAGVAPAAVTGLFQPYMGMWSDNLWLRTVGWDTANAVLARGEGSIKDDPGFLEGLELLQEFKDDGGFISGFEGTDFTPAQAQFFQGEAGMILMGSWLVGEMRDVIPEGFEIGVLPFPSVEGASGDQGALMSTAQLISVNAESENIPLALEWANLLTSSEVQTTRAEEFGELSAVLGVPSPTGVTGIDTVVADATGLVPREFSMGGTEAYELVYSEITRMLFGEQDAQATLDRLDEGLKKIYGN